MGIQVNRFVGKNKISDEFICGICRDIIDVPKQINCNCERIFCHSCIVLKIRNQQTLKCPFDRIIVNKPYCINPSRYWVDNYNKIKVKCIFSNVGCKVQARVADIGIHEMSCEHNAEALVLCKEGCAAELSRKELKTHNCLAHLRKLIEKLAHSKPKMEAPQYCASIHDEIDSIKLQLKALEKKLNESIGLLNGSQSYDRLNGCSNKSFDKNKSSLYSDVNIYESIAPRTANFRTIDSKANLDFNLLDLN